MAKIYGKKLWSFFESKRVVLNFFIFDIISFILFKGY